MSVINDFSKYSQQRIVVNGEVIDRICFTFTDPRTQNPNISGYQLYADDSLVQQEKFETVVTSTGIVTAAYIYYDFPGKGEFFTFKIRLVSYITEIFSFSNEIPIQMSPGAVKTINAHIYRELDFNQTIQDYTILEWDVAENVDSYIIWRGILYDNRLGESSSIIENIEVTENSLIIHLTNIYSGFLKINYDRWEWVITSLSQKTIILTNDNLTDFSDKEILYTDISIPNVVVWNGSLLTPLFEAEEDNYPKSIQTSTGNYLYGIVTKKGVTENTFIENYAYILPELKNPYLLRWSQQTDPILKSNTWKNMKNVLVDGHYYNKDYYAIPYKEEVIQEDNSLQLHQDAYILDGYIGAENEIIEVYINGHLKHTVTSQADGSFKFPFNPVLGPNRIRLTTATPQRAPRSKIYEIGTYRIYTHFAALGKSLDELDTTLNNVRDNFLLTKADLPNLVSNFASQVNLFFSKSVDTNLENFRKVVASVLHSHLDFGLHVSLITLSDGFKDYYSEFVIHENNSHLTPFSPKTTEIIGSPNLFRGKYYYGVSGVNSDGGETDISILIADKRWWPFYFVNGIGIQWELHPQITKYRIYRGTSISTMRRIAETPNEIYTSTGIVTVDRINKFIDNGTVHSTEDDLLPTSTGNMPFTFNFTNSPSITSLEELKINLNLDDIFMLKRKTQLTITLTTDLEEFPDLIFSRLWNYASLAITPLKLRLILGGPTFIMLKETDDDTILFKIAPPVIDAIYSETITSDKWNNVNQYYVYDIEHNLDRDDILPRATIQGESVIAGFMKISSNVMRIYWNIDEEMEIYIVRISNGNNSN